MRSDADITTLADTFRLLGDATRVRIVDALSAAELCVSDIARQVGLSESAVSHQLRLLRGMRVVRPRRAGRMVYYALDDRHILELFHQGLQHVLERNGNGGAPGGERARRGAPRGERGERGE
jgi:DNA-binding transcriptional ArsR family regulator